MCMPWATDAFMRGCPSSRRMAVITSYSIHYTKLYETHMGGLRLDYVLPSRDLQVLDSGVYWPAPGEPRAYLVADEQGRQQPGRSSDHRLVWVDVAC